MTYSVSNCLIVTNIFFGKGEFSSLFHSCLSIHEKEKNYTQFYLFYGYSIDPFNVNSELEARVE